MDHDRAGTVGEWNSRSVEAGYAGLRRLAAEEFSGVVTVEGTPTRAVLTNGRIVGVADGDLEDLEGRNLVARVAPDDALPLLFAMEQRGGETRARYYTEETPLSEVHRTLEEGGFTGYVELSENVLSGDYYVVYHGGRSSSVAFVGSNDRLIDGDEAFERAADEVGIYQVVDADVTVIDVPEDEGSAAAAVDDGSATGDDAGPDGPGDEPADGAGAGDASSIATGAGSPGDAADADAPLNPGPADDAGDAGSPADDPPTSDASATDGASSGAGGPYGGGEEIRVGAGLGLDEDSADDSDDRGESGDVVCPTGTADGDAGGDPGGPDHAADAADATDEDDTAAGPVGDADPAGAADARVTDDDPAGVDWTGGDERAAVDRDERRGVTVDESGDADPPEPEPGPVAGAAESGGESETNAEGTPDPGTAPEATSEAPVDDPAPSTADDWTAPADDPTAADAPGADGVDDRSAGGPDDAPADERAGAGDAAVRTPTTDTEPSTEDGPSARSGIDEGERASEVNEAEAGAAPVDRAAVTDDRAATGGVEIESEEGAGTAGTGDKLRETRAELERVRAERDERRDEAERLRERIETLEARIEELATSQAEQDAGDEDGEAADVMSLSPRDALADTNLFVRYESKSEPTLEAAHGGEASAEAVNGNLRIEHHTGFAAERTTVDGEPFEAFLESSLEYRFVRWVVRDLLYELRSTGNRRTMEALYDAIPEVDRIEFDGEVRIGGGPAGEEERRGFDVILRDRMGKPLAVAGLHAGREPAGAEPVETLLADARTVAAEAETVAAGFTVAASYYEPPALKAAADATGGGFLSRGRRKGYVKLDRKRGFHLCLVEARDGEFNLNVPEL